MFLLHKTHKTIASSSSSSSDSNDSAGSSRSFSRSLSFDDDLEMATSGLEQLGIQPYQFEPKIPNTSDSDDGSSGEEDDDDRSSAGNADDHSRLTNSDW